MENENGNKIKQGSRKGKKMGTNLITEDISRGLHCNNVRILCKNFVQNWTVKLTCGNINTQKTSMSGSILQPSRDVLSKV